jgi:prepilin-type N-terminal cleavage/methylation domain-containing protein
MSNNTLWKSQNGFTLIEIIAVLVILSCLAAITFTKVEAISVTASQSVIEDAISKLNTREILIWTNMKLSDGGWVEDEAVFSQMNFDLGPDYHWGPEPDAAGGKLHFKSEAVALDRDRSTFTSSGKWRTRLNHTWH